MIGRDFVLINNAKTMLFLEDAEQLTKDQFNTLSDKDKQAVVRLLKRKGPDAR